MMKPTRLARTAAPAAALLLVLGACNGTGGEDEPTTDATTADNDSASGDAPSGVIPGSVVRVNWGGFPESWAPGAEMEAGYMRVPYENLVALGEGSVIEPVLATAWEETDEALTLTLREGVTFHDGTPLDADAVRINLETVQNTPGPYAGPFSVVESFEVVDELTLRLNLSRPAPSLLTTLSTRAAPIASPTAIEAGTVAQSPVGTGPWAYDEAASTAGTRMVFTYVEDYWGDPVAYETVELLAIPEDNAATGALINGEIDITDTELNQFSTLEAAGNVEILEYPAIRNNPIFFDRGPGGVFEDVDVRRAACYAIDTAVLVELEPDWEQTTQHFAEDEFGHNPAIEGYPHDLERAQQLYDSAGNPPVDIEMLATFFNERQMQIYASQLAEIGMQVTVQTAPPPQFFSEWNSGRYPLGLGGNDELTPYDWYTSWFAEDAPGNPAGVESAELEAAAEAAIDAGASEEAEALWQEVMWVIADEALTCNHVAGQELIAWNTDSVAGVAEPPQPWETVLIDYRALRPAGS